MTRHLTNERVLAEAKSITEMMRARGLISYPAEPDKAKSLSDWIPILLKTPLRVPKPVCEAIHRSMMNRKFYRATWTSRQRHQCAAKKQK